VNRRHALRIHRDGRSAGLRRQRGVAMMVAILLVAFGTILAAAIGFKAAMAARRSTATMAMDQSLLIAEAAEALAAYALREDYKSGGQKQTHPAQSWAQPLGPVEVVPGVVLEAYVEDASSRFNLNSLIDANNAVDPVALQKLESLMEQAGVEPKFAAIIADWIDPDTQPINGGAEDSVYAAQTPPYRAANTLITSPSELLAMPEFGRERYVKLLPYVTALPRDAKINVCSASGLLLDAMVDPSHKNFSRLDPKEFAKQREAGCFPMLDVYSAEYGGQASQDWAAVKDRVSEVSSYFRVTSIVTIGSAEFTLYSLLWRDTQGTSHVLMRTYSPD
jgi:general secretion pathway protein K